MMETNVYTPAGEKKETVLLPHFFGGKVNVPLMHEVVTAYLANQRRGTAETKTRSDVSGGGRKPFRQKEAGRARAGSNRSPLWRHGGIVFGPHPRSYRQNIPKQKLRTALFSALSAKVKDDAVLVLTELLLENHKTKGMIEILTKLGVNRDKTLLVLPQGKLDQNLKLATRNVVNLSILQWNNLNVFTILAHKKIVFCLTALHEMDKYFSATTGSPESAINRTATIADGLIQPATVG